MTSACRNFMGTLLLFSCGARAQLSDPLEDWQVIATPSVSIRGLAYQEGTFVAVGATTNIIVSTNGVNWFSVPTGLSNYYGGLLAVTAGAGQFVAVGAPGIILSSPDGFEWTQRRRSAPGQYEEFWAVTYGGDTFVAVGFPTAAGALAATSTDGIHWETFLLPINTTPRNVAYGNGLYVAAGSPLSMVSSNGRDWTPLAGIIAQGIAFGAGQFIATLMSSGYASTNGMDWTEIPLPVLGERIQNYYTAAHANGRFIIAGFCDDCPNTNRPSLLATSADGRHWTSRRFGAETYIGPIRDIVFVDGAYYLGDQWGRIWKSGRTPPVATPAITELTRSGGQTRFSFNTVAGFHYAVDCANRLDAPEWKPYRQRLFATGDRLSVVDPEATDSNRFYRVRIE